MHARRLSFHVLAAVILSSALLAPSALARNVYLNGIKLDSSVQMKAQTFSGCDVRIDEAGDVYITAKGYKVVPTDGGAAASGASPGAAVTPRAAAGPKPLWLISRQSQRGVSQYDVDVFVNDQFVTKVRSADDPVVLDVSRFVTPGENRVRMVAVKNLGERRVSSSPTDSLEVLIGEGQMGGSTVHVDKVHVTFRRTANETSNIREDFSFNVSKVGN